MYSKFAFLEAKLNLRTSSTETNGKKYLNHTFIQKIFPRSVEICNTLTRFSLPRIPYPNFWLVYPQVGYF